jgi:hypothetical protein
MFYVARQEGFEEMLEELSDGVKQGWRLWSID